MNHGVGVETPHVCKCSYISKTTKGYRRHKSRRCPYTKLLGGKK